MYTVSVTLDEVRFVHTACPHASVGAELLLSVVRLTTSRVVGISVQGCSKVQCSLLQVRSYVCTSCVINRHVGSLTDI
jgi:hypothetical protein